MPRGDSAALARGARACAAPRRGGSLVTALLVPLPPPLPVCEKDHTLVTRGWARGPRPGRALPSATRCPASHGAGLRLAAPGLAEPSPRLPGGFPRTLSWPCPQAARRRSGHVCWAASLRPGPGPRPRRCPGSTARAGSPSSRVSGRCRVTVTVTSPARGASSTAACSSRL